VKVVRATPNDSGFISDVTSSAITCSVGNNPLPSAPISASVPAGGTVQVLWNTWPLGHYGPVMNYLAKCPGSCSSYKGDSGNVWVKFQQETYANGIWASDALANNNHSYTVTIPSGLAPGEYVSFHPLFALTHKFLRKGKIHMG
jgi:lytic cellulose monooxygenase (C1-hydroxylating)